MSLGAPREQHKQSWQLKGLPGALGNSDKHEDAGTWAELGREQASPPLGRVLSDPALSGGPGLSQLPPARAHHQGTERRGLEGGGDSHLTAPNHSILTF